MIKRVYSQPTTKALVVRFAGVFLASNKNGIQNSNVIDDEDWNNDGWDELD